jgi:hypothetical protein
MKACTALMVAMMACLTAPIFAQFPGGPGRETSQPSCCPPYCSNIQCYASDRSDAAKSKPPWCLRRVQHGLLQPGQHRPARSLLQLCAWALLTCNLAWPLAACHTGDAAGLGCDRNAGESVGLQAQYFKNDADTAINEDNYTFGKRVANAPTPSDRSAPRQRHSRMHACRHVILDEALLPGILSASPSPSSLRLLAALVLPHGTDPRSAWGCQAAEALHAGAGAASMGARSSSPAAPATRV